MPNTSDEKDETNGTRQPRLLVCNCQRTMAIDAALLTRALGRGRSTDAPGHDAIKVHSALCRDEIERYRAALEEREGDAPLIVACTQEAPLFAEIAEEMAKPEPQFVNIRELAGWCEAGTRAGPKMAALLAAATYEPQAAGLKTIKSEGQCLVYGAGQRAIEVAEALAGRLSVTLLLTSSEDVLPPSVVRFPICKGRISKLEGALGSFEVVVDGYAEMVPSSRDALTFTLPRDGARSRCDLIFDLSGGTPLVRDASRRDGYFRVDPDHPAAVAKAMFEIVDYVGEFEKPLYVTYDAGLCAHGRSGKVGCSKCLDHCPLSAIAEDKENSDHIVVDPAICGGCGSCSAHCPTGAIAYTFPQARDVIGRARLMLETYLNAGGERPILLLYEERHGGELIAAMARYGRGLPHDVLPLGLYSITQVGHHVLASLFAAGAAGIVLLAAPERAGELTALEAEIALTNHILEALGFGPRRAILWCESDPDAIEGRLYDLPRSEGPRPASFLLPANKRELARLALAKLHEGAPAAEVPDVIALPEGAPYGRIAIRKEGCTLCLACVGCCPAGALADNPDRPEVRFTEAACVQCGLCVATCPEHVITLEPRYDFTTAALSPVVLNEESPFECIRCGRPFAAKSTIERIIATLHGKNPMFQTASQLDLIKMCDDCRIVALSEEGGDPMAFGERPRVRTTEDYLSGLSDEAEEKADKEGG